VKKPKREEILSETGFDAISLYWSTIIGYCGGEAFDAEILRRIRRITRSDWLLTRIVSFEL